MHVSLDHYLDVRVECPRVEISRPEQRFRAPRRIQDISFVRLHNEGKRKEELAEDGIQPSRLQSRALRETGGQGQEMLLTHLPIPGGLPRAHWASMRNPLLFTFTQENIYRVFTFTSRRDLDLTWLTFFLVKN